MLVRRCCALLIPLVMVTSVGAQEEASTWSVIQDHIFGGNCASCHQAGTGFARQSDLVLTDDVAYEQLVDVEPKNVAAQADGLLRVSSAGGVQGLFQSFLWEKIYTPDQEHFYADHPDYGALMPLGGPSLTNGELEFIGQWILNGAPQTGNVVDVSLLDDTSRYEPPEFEPLDPPEQGIQLHLGPFDVWSADLHDREFYYFQPHETAEDLYVSRYEIAYRSNSHHFILYNYKDGDRTPEAEVFRDLRTQEGVPLDADAAGLFPFKTFIATQTPKTDYHLPDGIAMRLPKGSGFDLNVHSVNRSGELQEGEVYVNLHTVDIETLDHVADYDNFGNFDIELPPNETTTISKTFTFRQTRNLIQLWSHAHEKMTEFRIEHAGGERDGELIYWTNDWEHPPLMEFNDEPLTFFAGDQVRIITTWRNDTDETVRFGPLSSDEMQFMFYVYYPYSPIAGDVNEDLTLDVEDIDLLSRRVRSRSRNARYDLNFDGVVDGRDRVRWVERLANTYFGDSNLDGLFDSTDLVAVFAAGEYEDDVVGNSTWATGDWDGDSEFGTADLVMAFSSGGYNQARRTTVAVPEPATMILLLIGLSLIGYQRRG